MIYQRQLQAGASAGFTSQRTTESAVRHSGWHLLTFQFAKRYSFLSAAWMRIIAKEHFGKNRISHSASNAPITISCLILSLPFITSERQDHRPSAHASGSVTTASREGVLA